MKVKITDIAPDIELGNNGIILEIRDNSDKHRMVPRQSQYR